MRRASALSILLAAYTAPALAQDAEQRGIAPEERPAFDDTLEQAGRERYQQLENTPEARAAIESYGRCAAERQPGEANRLLTMDFNTSRYRNGLRLLSQDVQRHCARESVGSFGMMRSANLLFSGAIAEALLEADATPLNARLAHRAAAQVTSYSPSDTLALCLARSLPDQVAALFATVPGSEAEAAAAAPLTQALPACARAAAIEADVEITVPAMRAMTATAAYRLLATAENTNA
jgi:hypothetical protein